MSADCECIVIGAGVVGLAIAASLAQSGRDVLILERQSAFGTMTSARNSEVIHAGIYYAADSLKARFCIAGKHALYDYCQQKLVNHKRTGKLIVATSEEQVQELEGIRQRAIANGVDDLQMLTQGEAQMLEPALSCLAALHSPSTGIVDSHGLMLSLLGDAESEGASLAVHAPVKHISRKNNLFEVEVGGDDPMTISCQWVVNTAGHGACDLAASINRMPNEFCPKPIFSKGNYFSLQAKAPFSHLVYPVPRQGGLGVHITVDLAGRARFGPDVEVIENEDYEVDPKRANSFYAEIRRYWPELPDDSLTPDYAGIRPKINLQGSLYPDFMITSEQDHGIPRLINLFGIESPGLTSSLAIADYVRDLFQQG
ncbi:MAG: NAD(P)/FAD-dependent oxidoreductase [Granulosicoccus sp.]